MLTLIVIKIQVSSDWEIHRAQIALQNLASRNNILLRLFMEEVGLWVEGEDLLIRQYWLNQAAL